MTQSPAADKVKKLELKQKQMLTISDKNFNELCIQSLSAKEEKQDSKFLIKSWKRITVLLSMFVLFYILDNNKKMER